MALTGSLKTPLLLVSPSLGIVTQQENSVGYSRSYSVLVSYSLRGGGEVSNSLQVSNHVSNISSPQRDLYEM